MGMSLKQIRETRGLKQREVAKLAGISRSHYTKIEDGVRTPRLPVAKKVSDALRIDLNTFLFALGRDITSGKEGAGHAEGA